MSVSSTNNSKEYRDSVLEYAVRVKEYGSYLDVKEKLDSLTEKKKKDRKVAIDGINNTISSIEQKIIQLSHDDKVIQQNKELSEKLLEIQVNLEKIDKLLESPESDKDIIESIQNVAESNLKNVQDLIDSMVLQEASEASELSKTASSEASEASESSKTASSEASNPSAVSKGNSYFANIASRAFDYSKSSFANVGKNIPYFLSKSSSTPSSQTESVGEKLEGKVVEVITPTVTGTLTVTPVKPVKGTFSRIMRRSNGGGKNRKTKKTKKRNTRKNSRKGSRKV